MNPRSRPVGRDRPGTALLAGVSGLVALLGVMAAPGDASPKDGPTVGPGPLRIGMNSCASRGCHGAVDATEPGLGRVFIKDGAYTTWLNYDPHARAYAALLGPRSVAMAARLDGPLGGQPAHRAGLCLSCHSTVGPPEARPLDAVRPGDGISCEACHGPAESWRDKHLSPAWRALPASTKALDGLTDLATPAARARSCVGCHVGDRSRGMDVNHDLIAAGHPRLNFEFATYQAGYPKHWRESHEGGDPAVAKAASAEFEAKSWAIGQVVTAEAALDLLAARALDSEGDPAARRPPAPVAIWPEFASYECFACHHDLADPGPRQAPGHSPGRLPWETWPSAMLPALAAGHPGIGLAPLDEVRAEMARPIPDPIRVARLAALGKQRLVDLLRALEAEAFDAARIGSLLEGLAGPRPDVRRGWDRASQHYLALQALARASEGLGLAIGPEVEATIRQGSAALEFPANYDSPRAAPPPARRADPARPVR